MNYLLKSVLGLVFGAIAGAIVGGVVLTLPTLFENKCGLWGCTRDWAPIAFFVGGIIGGIAGAVIGLVIGIVSSSRLISLGIGAVAGLIITITLFAMGAGGDPVVGLWAFLSTPAAALVGLITGEGLRLTGVSRETTM